MTVPRRTHVEDEDKVPHISCNNKCIVNQKTLQFETTCLYQSLLFERSLREVAF